VAFFAGPDQGGDLLVGDRSGKTTVLSRGWQVILGLAWSPRGDEVWFGASKGDIAPALYAVSLSGKERMMLQAPEALSLQDVSRDGRALVLSVKARGNLACLVPGEKEERELGWHDSSWVEDLSADGRTVLFTETQGGGAPNGAVYLRGTDGSPAVRLGDGHAEGLSPDGSRALAKTRRGPPQLMLLPTRAGSPRTLPAPGLESIVEADWIDDRRIVFSGRQSGKPQRGLRSGRGRRHDPPHHARRDVHPAQRPDPRRALRHRRHGRQGGPVPGRWRRAEGDPPSRSGGHADPVERGQPASLRVSRWARAGRDPTHRRHDRHSHAVAYVGAARPCGRREDHAHRPHARRAAPTATRIRGC
jgi:hypothetical protein